MEQIIATVRSFEGALVVVPEPGGDFPELAWGDAFFYYAPDGRMPANVQPYGTIITKNHPDDAASDLDPPGRWRVNVNAGRRALSELAAGEPGGAGGRPGPAAADEVVPHPVYGALGWISVVNPGARTQDTVVRLLRAAHDAARARAERRHATGRAQEDG
ncbi:hypothetical protein AMK16_01850 [Streptomyces sp. CB00455]|uniref:DUF6194 family protein n=1 Tax=Streptomyces sp. CB00455 TaxID=1703927 RepID=UPI00093ADF3C|nr:DUF6194 family protein [Streptomyces sp. CB00455]OKK22006.1 hypothetical protein AMK16_01850 [Streptomyces sp. CB00455]